MKKVKVNEDKVEMSFQQTKQLMKLQDTISFSIEALNEGQAEFEQFMKNQKIRNSSMNYTHSPLKTERLKSSKVQEQSSNFAGQPN